MKSIDEANQDALKRILDGDPHLVDVIPAAQAIPALKDHGATDIIELPIAKIVP